MEIKFANPPAQRPRNKFTLHPLREVAPHRILLLGRQSHLDIVGIRQPFYVRNIELGEYKIVHVAFGFSEFHFIHTLTGVPMLLVSQMSA